MIGIIIFAALYYYFVSTAAFVIMILITGDSRQSVIEKWVPVILTGWLFLGVFLICEVFTLFRKRQDASPVS
jgi:hypothetical protein